MISPTPAVGLAPQNPFDRLSDEILDEVFDRLSDSAMARASQVCRRWHAALANHPAWHREMSARYGMRTLRDVALSLRRSEYRHRLPPWQMRPSWLLRDGPAEVALWRHWPEFDGGAGPPLHAAARSANLTLMRGLLRLGASPARRDFLGRTPLEVVPARAPRAVTLALLHAGAPLTFAPLARLVRRWAPTALAEALSGRTIPATLTNAAGETLLHVAAGRGRHQAVGPLVAAGCDAEQRDLATWSPLEVAARRDDWPTVRALVRAGAQLDAACAGGYVALHQAAQQPDPHLVQRMIDELGASVPAAQARHGLLHLASRCGYSDTMVYLIEDCHLRADASDARGKTPLHMLRYARFESRAPAARLLLSYGADPAAVDGSGISARRVLERAGVCLQPEPPSASVSAEPGSPPPSRKRPRSASAATGLPAER